MRASGGGSQPLDAPFSPANGTPHSLEQGCRTVARQAPSSVRSEVACAQAAVAYGRSTRPLPRRTPHSPLDSRTASNRLRQALSSIRSEVAWRKRRRNSGSARRAIRDGRRLVEAA